MTSKKVRTWGYFGIIVMILSLAFLPTVALAQDSTAQPDYQATADVLQWRANSARATAQAADLQATASAQLATADAIQTATVEAERIRQEATQTASAHLATVQAGELLATKNAGDVLATRQSLQWEQGATATTGAIQAESTAQALEIERAKRTADREKATNAFLTYVAWAGLAFAVLIAIGLGNRLVSWALDARARRRSGPGGWDWGDGGDVLDGDYQDDLGTTAQRIEILALPEPGQTGLFVDGDGKWWRQ